MDLLTQTAQTCRPVFNEVVAANDWQLAYEIYEILEEYDDGVIKTTSKSMLTFNHTIII